MPSRQVRVKSERPECPKCGMNMIMANRRGGARQTYECLRCGYIDRPSGAEGK
jgi:ribosomal protein S27AE